MPLNDFKMSPLSLLRKPMQYAAEINELLVPVDQALRSGQPHSGPDPALQGRLQARLEEIEDALAKLRVLHSNWDQLLSAAKSERKPVSLTLQEALTELRIANAKSKADELMKIADEQSKLDMEQVKESEKRNRELARRDKRFANKARLTSVSRNCETRN